MRHENPRIRESFHLEQIPHFTFTLFCVGTPDTPNIKVKVRVIVPVTRVVPSSSLQCNVYDTCTHNNTAITDSSYYHFPVSIKNMILLYVALYFLHIYTGMIYQYFMLSNGCSCTPGLVTNHRTARHKVRILRPRPGYLGWWGRSFGLLISKHLQTKQLLIHLHHPSSKKLV